MKSWALSALVIGQLLLGATTQAQTVTNKPASISSLAQAWEWGLEEVNNQSNAWIAFGYTVELDEKLEVGLSSRHDDFIEWNRPSRGRWGGRWSGEWYNIDSGGWRNRHSLASLQANVSTPQDDYTVQQRVLFLARYEDNAIAELRVIEEDALINWFDLPVYWLGDVSQQESFTHQQSMLSPLSTDAIQRTIVRSLGLHNIANRDDVIIAIANDESRPALRFAAIESIAFQKSDSVAEYLADIAQDENEVLGARKIAISALSRYNSTSNLRLLSELSNRMNPQGVRQEAIASLSLIPGETSNEVLRELATVDDDRHIVMAALAGLSRRPSEYDTVADVAENHRDEEIRETALELAAYMDGRRAFSLLQRLFERDPSEDVREEALQAMDEVPAELAVPFLLELTGNELVEEDYRAEAVDTLAEFDASMVLTDLNRLAWSDSNEEVRENAVRGLADLDDPSIGGLLLEIARNHPSRHTRMEAMDELEDRVL